MAAETDNTQPITLGALIDLLEARPLDDQVSFDFCGLIPDGVDSYRGYYDHLAIGFKDGGESATVGELLKLLRDADGATYEGYKGGQFRMTRETPMWVANYGQSGSTAITGIVEECTYWTFIRTAHCEDWAGAMESARRTLRAQGFPV